MHSSEQSFSSTDSNPSLLRTEHCGVVLFSNLVQSPEEGRGRGGGGRRRRKYPLKRCSATTTSTAPYRRTVGAGERRGRCSWRSRRWPCRRPLAPLPRKPEPEPELSRPPSPRSPRGRRRQRGEARTGWWTSLRHDSGGGGGGRPAILWTKKAADSTGRGIFQRPSSPSHIQSR